jgi:uncharacterized protein (DUF2126 family)
VSLQDTGVAGEAVCGVRFKAFNPPSTLHPTRPPIHSLVIDLVDIWTGRVVAGCTYVPPRPAITGLTGPVPATAAAGEGRPSDRQHAMPVIMPAWSAGGVFLPTGSGLKYRVPPPADIDLLHPYLLDLARMD